MNKPRKDAATLLSEIMNTSFDKGSKVGMGEEPLSGGADEPDSRPELSTIETAPMRRRHSIRDWRELNPDASNIGPFFVASSR